MKKEWLDNITISDEEIPILLHNMAQRLASQDTNGLAPAATAIIERQLRLAADRVTELIKKDL